jgi:hypothetical protein
MEMEGDMIAWLREFRWSGSKEGPRLFVVGVLGPTGSKKMSLR